MSNEMTASGNNKLADFINGLKSDFEEVLINNNVSFKQEAYFAIQLLEKNNYAMNIARNSPKTLRNAVINVATIGLSLNSSMGLAYLVPRKNEICLDISYLGLIKLAQDTGGIIEVKAELVHANDTFAVNGAFKEPTHSFSPFEDRGELKGAYVVARTPNNSFLTTIMTIDEIFEIRDSSESYKNPKSRAYSPWCKYEGEMIKKTVVRRAFKSWPKSEHTYILDRAIEISDNAQAIEFKTDYQIEQDEMNEDFPIPPEEKIIGSPEYRIQNAKLRGKQLKDIDNDDLYEYMELLEKRHLKHDAKPWELELKMSIREYLEENEKDQND